ncbi:MAG: divergent polysaccharide deacetylase family protein [Desulfatirhabdiaceae bacterium]
MDKKKQKKKTGGNRKKKSSTSRTVYLKRIMICVGILIILVLIAGLALNRLMTRKAAVSIKPPPPPPVAHKIKPPVTTPTVKAPSPKPADNTPVPTPTVKPPVFEVYPLTEPAEPAPITSPPLPEIGKRPRAAIVIDDMGYDIQAAKRLIQVDPAITWSVLPGSPFQKQIVHMASEAGVEIMLHLPMEPREFPHVDPGPGALLASMNPDQLIAQLNSDLDAVAHIRGVNNHMGSRLTALSPQMDQVLSTIKLRNLFFIDSRTTSDSMIKSSAKLFRVPFAQRDVFLDHVVSPDAVRKQIHLLIQTAMHKGHAIAIGHPHDVTCRILSEKINDIRKSIQIVPASELTQPPN